MLNKIQHNNTFKRYTGVFLLLVFILLVFSHSYNLHIHRTKTGNAVVHSHLPSQTSDPEKLPKHSHNSLEFLTILASHIFIFFSLITLVFVLNKIKTSHKFQKNEHFPSTDLSFSYIFRAPPQ